MLFSPSTYLQDTFEVIEPKSSAGEITVITPENKTYTEPDSGYYPSTYGFEDELGQIYGSNIRFIDEYQGYSQSTYCLIKTIPLNRNGHNDIMYMSDAQGGMYMWGVHNFDDPQSTGTIEFYLSSDGGGSGSALERHDLQFRSSGNTIAFRIMIQLHDDKIVYYDGSSWQEIASIIDEEWYHHSISFDCEAGIKGQFTWIITDSLGNEVGRVENIEFENDLSTVDEMYFGSRLSDYGIGGTWWDAFGFSWDPNYNTGDNLNEGLLLGYDTTTPLQWQGYSLDGQENVTIYGNYTIPVPVNGTHTIQVFVTDSIGTTYESSIRHFTYGTTSVPKITIISPTPDEFFNNDAPDFEISIFGTLINTTWYTIDDGATNITFSGLTGTIDQAEWNKKGDGDINLRFYVNNTLGNSSYSDVSIKKDTTPSLITIDSPLENKLFGKLAPEYNLTIIESNIDLMWYTLDYGVTNITHALFNGTIDQSEWNKIGNGTADIRFYVLDKAENAAYADVTIRKEISDPIVIINAPLADELFGFTAPFFNVSVIEPNFDSMWYTLDDGMNNVTASGFTGDISQAEWNKKSSGLITIKFYANDLVGNIGFAEVNVRKDVTTPIKPPTIVELLAEADIFTQKTKTSNINVYDYSGPIPFLRLGLYEFSYDLGGYISEIYVRFNLPKIENIRSMVLQLSYWDGYPIEADDDYEVNASLVSNDWVETTTIWTERPEYLGTSTLIYLNNPGLESEIYIDLLNLVEGLTDTTITIRLCPNNLSRIRFPAPFKSTESHGITPKLILEFDDPPTINSPTLNELFGTSAPSFNVEIYDVNLDSMWYTLDNGLTNTTFTTNGTINQALWDALPEGNVYLRFYANDSVGNIGFAEITIRKDVTAPILAINNPQNSHVIGPIAPNFDVSIEELNLDKTWYSLNGGNNITCTRLTGTINQALWDALPDGNVYFRFYANDSAGNIGFAEIIIRKDVTAPIITINSPTSNELFGTTAPSFNVEIYDANLDSMWYTIDGGVTNITYTTNGTIDQNNWTAHIDGPVTLTFYANDTLGNTNSAQVIINKDIAQPIIDIITPLPDQLFGANSPDFTVEIYDLNLDTMWYTIDGGVTNITFSANGTIDQNNWTAHIDGPVTLTFYANDTLGRTNSTQVIINKDITLPTINIVTPTTNQYFSSNSPDFIVEIGGNNLDTFWYSLDNGVNNFIFSTNETINQAVWDSIPNGTVIIKFYANDTINRITFTEVNVKKDVEDPIISIVTPTMNEVFEIPPAYEIAITEANLDKIWYIFDGGTTKLFISSMIGILNQTLWNQLPNGYVTIRFYANDTLGNMSFDEVIVVKDTPTPSPPPGIPGYNVFILLGMMSLIAAVIIRRKFNKV